MVFPRSLEAAVPFLFNTVAGEKGVPGIPVSYKFASSRDEGCSKIGRTMMESQCYHVHGEGEARAAHLAIGNRAFS